MPFYLVPFQNNSLFSMFIRYYLYNNFMAVLGCKFNKKFAIIHSY